MRIEEVVADDPFFPTAQQETRIVEGVPRGPDTTTSATRRTSLASSCVSSTPTELTGQANAPTAVHASNPSREVEVAHITYPTMTEQCADHGMLQFHGGLGVVGGGGAGVRRTLAFAGDYSRAPPGFGRGLTTSSSLDSATTATVFQKSRWTLQYRDSYLEAECRRSSPCRPTDVIICVWSSHF